MASMSELVSILFMMTPVGVRLPWASLGRSSARREEGSGPLKPQRSRLTCFWWPRHAAPLRQDGGQGLGWEGEPWLIQQLGRPCPGPGGAVPLHGKWAQRR